MNEIIELDLKSLWSRKVLTDRISSYAVNNGVIYFVSEYDERMLCRFDGEEKEELLNLNQLIDDRNTSFYIALTEDNIFIDAMGLLFCYSLKDKSIERINSDYVYMMETHNNVLYFTETEKNNLFRLNQNLKKERMNDLYCTYLSFSGEWVYFANWNENGGLYRSNLTTDRCDKITDDIISNLSAGINIIYYLSESDDYKLCMLNLSNNHKEIINIIPYGMITYKDNLYFSLDYKSGIYHLDRDKRISKIYDSPACNFKINNGKLYFMSSNYYREEGELMDIPF